VTQMAFHYLTWQCSLDKPKNEKGITQKIHTAYYDALSFPGERMFQSIFVHALKGRGTSMVF
jgi:hypothetical protein